MLSGTHENMKQIENSDQLNEWCTDSLDWLKKAFGTENLVSAVLHLDEKTPHIHASIVPVVTGERRKAKSPQPETKKKYKKKPVNAARLCADDVMARSKLKEYQDSYATAMQKYGLQRGIDGSETKHISTQQFYRDLFVKNENLKKNIEILQEEKADVYEQVRDMYDRKSEAQEKLLNMHEHLQDKTKELATLEIKLQQAKQDYEPYKAQEELTLIHRLFPNLKEQLQFASFCTEIGIALNSIKALFEGKTLTAQSFSFFSPEHNRKFTAENVKLKMEKDENKFRLNINGKDILEWFREKYQASQTQKNNQKKQFRL